MTQSTEPTENHNEALTWPMELKGLESELDDHVHQTGSELDFFRSEIDREESKLKAVGTIAHELAHVFLKHDETNAGLIEENEADALACRWGFAQEVKAMRQHCGPPRLG